jgi:hypothetical protein
MRRGPSTAICTFDANVRIPTKKSYPKGGNSYWNDEEYSGSYVSHRLAYHDLWSQIVDEVHTRHNQKTSVPRALAGEDNHIQIATSPCEVKHMSLY